MERGGKAVTDFPPCRLTDNGRCSTRPTNVSQDESISRRSKPNRSRESHDGCSMKALVSAAFRWINCALAPFGVRLQRLHAPTRSFPLFFRHLKALNFDVQTVIDIGVAFGTPGIYRS